MCRKKERETLNSVPAAVKMSNVGVGKKKKRRRKTGREGG